ncbi:hypothetical protein BGZ80_010033 [Entomortierella chlamydospora]|uniref:FAD-binding domain-containing protein n=1 Tax=Entomortierella chlamydospora TaxID=101097 RepID=A0A9P6MVE6_9FUNG|nr:hypothetical protein BGZ79_005909 [Entomortierella chlamydospora]KAG0015130.1 hypothetical protein BGZ80_010033 [Entomortierella chlamydospora]
MSRPEPPNVLIVGAGIAGLFLAILLERQKVPYMIYERTKESKPIGSAIGLDVKIMPVMEQLGLLEELKSISLPGAGVEMFDPQLKFMTAILFKGYEEVTGYVPLMFPRPELHRLLRSHVPEEKIVYSKKVLSLEQNEHGAMLRMSDGTTVHGDIVVGADGTYSGVRQGLYKHLEKKGLLPASDKEELTLGHLCMVGTTNPVDPEKYPCVNNEKALFQRVIGKGDPYTWHTVNMRGNKICWGIIRQMDSTVASRDKMFRNSDWGSEGDEGVMNGAFDKPTPIGGTVRDLFEATPKEEISKVFLEEKLFETWYYGRTVLIGDACHKFLPSAGQGAVNAMQDAVVLANHIYEMGEATPENITAAFKEYRDERYGPAKRLMAKSKLLAILQYGMTWKDRLIRYIMFNVIPDGIKMKQFYKDTMHRPQVSYLEYVEARGTGEVLPQKPSKRYAQEKAAAKGEEVPT